MDFKYWGFRDPTELKKFYIENPAYSTTRAVDMWIEGTLGVTCDVFLVNVGGTATAQCTVGSDVYRDRFSYYYEVPNMLEEIYERF